MARQGTDLKSTQIKSETLLVNLPWKLRLKPETLSVTLILIFTFLIFSVSLKNEFLIGWDDGEYISNPLVSADGPIKTGEIFSNFHLGMYQPLAIVSFALNYKISGDTAWPYILTNLLLHLLNILLVFRLTKRWMKSYVPATVVALLFAIHPMHVEAVTWISTRSSGLYSLFFLLGLLMWDNYLEDGYQSKHYVLALLFALLALLSKSMAATFPLILFLMDYLKRRNFKLRLILEKLPFLALSVIFGIVAIKAAASFGHITVLEQDFSLIQRFFLIIYGIAFYLIKLFLPINLSAIYAFPESINGGLPNYVYSASILPVILTTGIWFSGKNRREFIFAGLFFLLSISMVLPLFWSRIFITADRYTYIPYIGLFMIVARYFNVLAESWETIDKTNRRMLMTASALIVSLMSVATVNRIQTWENTPTLLTDVIEKKRSDADMAHGYFYLANYYDAADKAEEAMKYYNLSLSRNSRYLLALNNRGILKGKAGNPLSAIRDFEEAISIKPDYAEAYYNRGVALYQTGDQHKACEDWKKSLKLGFNPAGDAITQYCRKSVLPDFDRVETSDKEKD